MQDLRTGEMVTLEQKEIFEQLKAADKTFSNQMEALQAACDKAIPDRSRHGPIFREGEILILRGGRFSVEKITREGLFLKGLPTKKL
jgi:hypothetical protein